MKMKLTWILLVIVSHLSPIAAQNLFRVEGDGRFNSPSSTNVDIQNTDDNTNALLRFGDNNIVKTSLGFNGNDDVFKISTAATLGANDFTMGLTGLIGINSLPGNHRFLINHNSTSGVDGSAHLTLQENNTGDFARLRFDNLGSNGIWTIAARATDGSSLMNFFYNDGTNFANVLSLDGDLFRVGIHETAPQAYLHIKQQDPGISALILENDDQTGGESWGMQIGNTNLNFLFEGVIRGAFSSATGAYTAFPPPAAFTTQSPLEEGVLTKVLQLNPVKISQEKSKSRTIGLNPQEVEKVNPDWVVRSEDGEKLGINYQQLVTLAVKSIQEQQALIDGQQVEIAELEAEEKAFADRLSRMEAKLATLAANTPDLPGLPAAGPLGTLPASPLLLEQNIPNPFREETTIRFSVPESALSAKVQLTTIQGKIVRNFSLSKGQNQISIKAAELENGTYFYSLIVDGELVETRQMVVMR